MSQGCRVVARAKLTRSRPRSWNCTLNFWDAARATCDDAPEPVEDDYAARHGDVDVHEARTPAAFRDDVAEAVRVERAAGAFVVAEGRAARVVLVEDPLEPYGYQGKCAWHLLAVGCPPADENPLKLQNCFVRRRRPTYVFVVTRTSFVGTGFSAGRGVLSYF